MTPTTTQTGTVTTMVMVETVQARMVQRIIRMATMEWLAMVGKPM
jgi:hypothetical protein